MIQYWTLFFIPLIATLLPLRVDKNLKNVLFLFFLCFASLLIGLRYRVGGDWGAYMEMFKSVGYLDFFSLFTLPDPSYYVLNWVSFKLGLGIFGVNVVGGLIFIYGILVFCRKQPMPWVGILVAVPYMVIVVGMGYSRQAIALGLVLLAFASWPQKKFIKFAMIIIIASTFHKSAIILLPLALFINRKNIKEKFFLGIPVLIIIGLYYLLQFLGTATYEAYFLTESYESRGVFIRVLMSAIPASIFLIFRKKFYQFEDNNLWYLISIALLLCLFTSFSVSTVTDRIALFFSPIQLMVYSRLPVIFQNRFTLTFIILNILLLYSLSLFVWLNYAFHSYAWVPYKSVFDM